jgi:hypothetical protein
MHKYLIEFFKSQFLARYSCTNNVNWRTKHTLLALQTCKSFKVSKFSVARLTIYGATVLPHSHFPLEVFKLTKI